MWVKRFAILAASGYACWALSSEQGYAFAGAGEKGPKLNPTAGFSWAGTLV